MSAIQATCAAPLVQWVQGAGPTEAPACPGLLPESEPPSIGELQDAMTELYRILSKMRGEQHERGKVGVEQAKTQRRLQEEAEAEALRRAQEEAEGGFFESGIFKAVVVVAAVAASVVSCGTLAGACVALAAVALSVGGSEVAKHGTFDDVFGQGSSQWIGLGMQITGAAVSCGTAFAASGSTALQNVGVAADTAKKVSNGAKILSGAAQITKGAGQIASSIREHDRELANADAIAARKEIARLQQLVELIIQGMEDAKESHQRAAEALNEAIQTANATDLALASATRV